MKKRTKEEEEPLLERILSPEERVKRAEEIYYRRKLNNKDIRVSSSNVNSRNEKKQFSLYRKMILQILICIVIYVIFYLIKNTNYIFSQDVINKTQEFLKTDINFEQITKQVTEFWNNNRENFGFLGTWFGSDNNQENVNTNQVNNDQNNLSNEQVDGASDANNNEKNNNVAENQTTEQTNHTGNDNTNEQINNTSNTNEQMNQAVANNTNTQIGIGGASSDEKTVETSSNGNTKKTQMELDAEYIKKNFSMQLPVKGTITSHYGLREATEIVSANHQGIDIGVNIGTTVVASMEGTVSVVSDEGEYGTHIKIVNKDVTTIYAHCSKILVKEGAKVEKGQKIALSGNTGKTTGPHLHFEIRRNERTVDPELILKWS